MGGPGVRWCTHKKHTWIKLFACFIKIENVSFTNVCQIVFVASKIKILKIFVKLLILSQNNYILTFVSKTAHQTSDFCLSQHVTSFYLSQLPTLLYYQISCAFFQRFTIWPGHNYSRSTYQHDRTKLTPHSDDVVRLSESKFLNNSVDIGKCYLRLLLLLSL